MNGAVLAVLLAVTLAHGALVIKINGLEDDIPAGSNNNDPSQANRICAALDSSGVLVAHEYCNRFYKCTFGEPVARRCPGNLLFEPSVDRCEWPETVNCGARIIPENDDSSNEGTWEGNGAGNDDPSQAPAICAAEGSDHIYIAHENCDEYYKCWAGRPVPLPCPSGYLFNPNKDYCDFPYNVNCGNRIIPDRGDNDNDGGNDGAHPEDEIPVGNNHDDPSQANRICGTADSSGVLVAHEICNQFYKCTFGLPVARSCPGNLLFDPTRDRCEWPDIVNCGSRIIPDPDDGDDGGVWEGNGAGNDDPSQAPAICAAEGSDHIYIAHENCDEYYKCWAGRPVALPCPSGFLFNPTKDYCDFPHNVNCGNRVIPDRGDDDNQGGNDSWNPEDDIPIGNNYDDPSQAPSICAAQDSSGVLVAHENCNQFYTCTFGNPVPQSCPGNLLFDPTRDRCEWPDIVNCGSRVIPDPEDGDDGGIWEGNGAGNDDPSQAPAICAAEGSDNIYIAHENCDEYYKCWAGRPVALPCPSGFLFNPRKDYCDFPHNVICGTRLIPDRGDDDNQGGNDSGHPEDDIPIGNNYDDPSQASRICAAHDSSGVLIAHENCNQFYTCTFGNPVPQSCPGNLLFDPTRDRCEWPDNVNCGSRVIPDPDDGDDGGVWEGNGAGNDDPSQAPAICAAEGSDHIYIAHEICTLYYKCWAGKPQTLACAHGLLFSPKKDYCDFPNNVDCGDRIRPAMLQ